MWNIGSVGDVFVGVCGCDSGDGMETSSVFKRSRWNGENSYLPGTETNRDPDGGFSRVRPLHCTSVGLTLAIIPNVDNSGA